VLSASIDHPAEVWRHPIERGVIDHRQALLREWTLEAQTDADEGRQAILDALDWLTASESDGLYLVIPHRPEAGPLTLGTWSERLTAADAPTLSLTLIERITVDSATEQIPIAPAPREDVAPGAEKEADEGKAATEEAPQSLLDQSVEWAAEQLDWLFGGGG